MVDLEGRLMKRLFLILTCLLCPSLAGGETLSVDGLEYSSIQAAVDDANHGDVIIVEPNIYYETIDFNGLSITLRSEDPNNSSVVEATIIDANNPADPNFGSAVLFRSGEGNDSILEGFTIRNGTGSWIPVSWEFRGVHWNRCGGGVLCYNLSAPTIRKNVFTNNVTGQGSGIYVYGDHVNANDPSNPDVHISP
ncbi:MAG: right-handed parallel beta-helix repeat-containing protein, partial [Planctomycetota bacterium]